MSALSARGPARSNTKSARKARGLPSPRRSVAIARSSAGRRPSTLGQAVRGRDRPRGLDRGRAVAARRQVIGPQQAKLGGARVAGSLEAADRAGPLVVAAGDRDGTRAIAARNHKADDEVGRLIATLGRAGRRGRSARAARAGRSRRGCRATARRAQTRRRRSAPLEQALDGSAVAGAHHLDRAMGDRDDRRCAAARGERELELVARPRHADAEPRLHGGAVTGERDGVTQGLSRSPRSNISSLWLESPTSSI